MNIDRGLRMPDRSLMRYNLAGRYSMDERGTELSDDVWVSSLAKPPEALVSGGRTYYRFLDHLFIPAPAEQLRAEQIRAINRYRQRNFEVDEQFKYNKNVKSVFRAVVGELNGRVLELGPSWFPLSPPRGKDYICCDFDLAALMALKERGYPILRPEELVSIPDDSISAVVSAFMFHFSVSDFLLDNVIRALKPDGLLLYNVISKDPRVKAALKARIHARDLRVIAVDLRPFFGKRDVLHLVFRSGARSIAEEAIDRIEVEIRKFEVRR